MNNKIVNIIKRTVLFKHLKGTRTYKYIRYLRFKRNRKIGLLVEAKREFNKLSPPPSVTWQDYKKAFNKYLVSFSEFMYQYEFYKLNDSERKKFVSRLEMRLYYERTIPPRIYELFWNKAKWLSYFNKYISRKWYDLRNITAEDLKTILKPNIDYIAKPIEGSLGNGIFKFSVESLNADLIAKLNSGNYVVEEVIKNEPTVAEFHPASLNTIRITTLADGSILGSFIRFGNNGNIVDNAHAGGIFAQIDPETGVIISNGIDTNGHSYERHPYSGKRFMGFILPQWERLVSTVREMHQLTPDAPIVGWDICVDSDNQVAVIEGNHLPDIDVLQSPLKIGLRDKIQSSLKKARLPQL